MTKLETLLKKAIKITLLGTGVYLGYGFTKAWIEDMREHPYRDSYNYQTITMRQEEETPLFI